MSATLLFKVQFQIRKSNASNVPGKVDIYRKDQQTALVAAASSHPKDILAVLTSNFTLATGETFDILHVAPFVAGTEGQTVLS